MTTRWNIEADQEPGAPTGRNVKRMAIQASPRKRAELASISPRTRTHEATMQKENPKEVRGPPSVQTYGSVLLPPVKRLALQCIGRRPS
jgi:hypothetical protein